MWCSARGTVVLGEPGGVGCTTRERGCFRGDSLEQYARYVLAKAVEGSTTAYIVAQVDCG